jgi:glycosyltransferase involved in cell wall biosynthesis
MNIWVIKDGEHLPVQEGAKKMRSWVLSKALCDKGHHVLWWSSTFSHQKKQKVAQSGTLEIEPHFKLSLIEAGSYSRNISFKRIRHHRRLAAEFLRLANQSAKPDLILCSFPTIEFAYAVYKYARQNNVPYVLDIRDLWPDIFIHKSPRLFQGLVRLILAPLFRSTRTIVKHAKAVVGVSDGYVHWAEKLTDISKTPKRVFFIGCEEFSCLPTQNANIEALKTSLLGKKIAIFIGSFGHSYQLELICEAAKTLEKTVPQLHIILVGDGEKMAAIQALCKSLKNVTLTGWLDKNDVAHLLKISHFGLAPCTHIKDSLPNKVFEYFAAGLPIVSSLEGEMERVLSVNSVGFSYRCGDLNRLCAHMAQLTQDDSLQMVMAQNVERLFKASLDSSAIYKKYVDFLEEVVVK